MIHKGLISKWKREAPDKCTGYELNTDMSELYHVMKSISQLGKLLKVVKIVYRINKTLKDIIGTRKGIHQENKSTQIQGIRWFHQNKISIHSNIVDCKERSWRQSLNPREIASVVSISHLREQIVSVFSPTQLWSSNCRVLKMDTTPSSGK